MYIIVFGIYHIDYMYIRPVKQLKENTIFKHIVLQSDKLYKTWIIKTGGEFVNIWKIE